MKTQQDFKTSIRAVLSLQDISVDSNTIDLIGNNFEHYAKLEKLETLKEILKHLKRVDYEIREDYIIGKINEITR